MKKGISLIVLVITIIVMIILAASVVITLSNVGIIDRASSAVRITDEQQAQEIANLVWAEAYMEGLRDEMLKEEVDNNLSKQGIYNTEWNILVSNTGINVLNKRYGEALGDLITSENYGNTINYEVNVNGTKYTDWNIFYEDETNGYVFLIKTNPLAERILSEKIEVDTTLTTNTLNSAQKELYNIFKLKEEGYLLNDEHPNSRVVVGLIKEYGNFANLNDYNGCVVGAIGGPTLELLKAAWNSNPNNVEIISSLGVPSIKYYGYGFVNAAYMNLEPDNFYIPTNYWYFLTSPSTGGPNRILVAGDGSNLIPRYGIYGHYKGCIRPVVCLKSNIVATKGNDNYDFNLVK